MPRTPDRAPGPSIEEELQLEDRGPGGDDAGDPAVEGALRRVTHSLRLYLGGIVRQLLQARNPPTDFDGIDLSGIANGQGLAYSTTTKRFEPQTFAGGYDSTTHRQEDQLVHDIAEGSYTEYVYSGAQVTDIIIWTDSGKTTKIRETNITYTGNKPTTIVNKQYDGTGTLAETYTETIGYTGNQVTSVTGVLS